MGAAGGAPAQAPAKDPVHTLRLVFGSVPESALGERTQPLRVKAPSLAQPTLWPFTARTTLAGETARWNTPG